MIKKQYSATERDFVFQWVDRWFQLNQLLYDLFKFNETSSPLPPTEVQELNYQSLRRWYIDHESQFIPLWRDFWEWLESNQHRGNEEIADMVDADELIETLSSFLYDPENLYQLIYGLGIQSGIDFWLPNEERAWKKMMELMKISEVVVGFVRWIRERT